MTDSQLKQVKNALLDVELKEIKRLEAFPDAPFEPSLNYTDKIKAIIEAERKRESSFLKLSAKKRTAVIIASVIAFLLIFTSCVFKEEIKDFVIDFYGTMTRFLSNNDDTSAELQPYTFTYIPDGYTLKTENEYPGFLKTIYFNEDKVLTINQSIISGNSIQIDSEDSSYKTTSVGNYTVHHINKNNEYTLFCKTETTIIYIHCHSSISWEEIEKMILGAVPKTE